MKLTSKIAATSFVALTLATSANAALITGTVEISADASVLNIDFNANSVTFTPSAPTLNAKVDASNGTLGSLVPVGTQVTYKNFTYSPLSVANPIWTNGITSFTLQSVLVQYEIPGFGVGLLGSGLISTTVPGYDPTPGTWSFSSDSSGASFSWSSTNTATRVPDSGTTIALLGASLLGLGAARRFFPALRK